MIKQTSERIKHLIKATKLICDSNVCPQSPRLFSYWWDAIHFAHKKGYLYLGFEGDTVDMVAIGFRVPKVIKSTGNCLPDKESGKILYVPVLASIAKDNLKLLKLLEFYRATHEINKIAYRYRGIESDVRIHNLRSNRTHVRA